MHAQSNIVTTSTLLKLQPDKSEIWTKLSLANMSSQTTAHWCNIVGLAADLHTLSITCRLHFRSISLLTLSLNLHTHTHVRARMHARTHTHTHVFNGPLSRTTWVSRYQKGKTSLDFTGARDSEWQWHQLGHMRQHLASERQPCQHPTAQFFTGRMPFLPPNQQRQSTEGLKHSMTCNKIHYSIVRSHVWLDKL